MRRGPRPTDLALLGGSLLLGATLVELSFRVALGRPAEPVALRYTEPDAVRGWRHRPGARASFVNGDYAINSRGLRDVERPLAPAPGVPRVLVVGDSFAEGFSVPFESAVARVLERTLRAEGCAAEVLNGGTVGYSTDQEYLFYRDEGAAYGPSVVVLLFYYNDILPNARGAVDSGTPKPLFTFVGGQPRVKNYPLPPRTPRPETGRPRLHGSVALAWIRDRLRDGAPRLHDVVARLGIWPRLRTEDVPQELRVFERDPPEPVRQAWLQTEHLLGLFDEEVRAHGARLAVAYVPSKMEVTQRDWQLTRQRYGVDETTWDRARVARLLEDAGRRLGFPVLDLTEPLWHADRGLRGGPYHSSGGHWNALGHEVAAREIARWLEEGHALPCAVDAPRASAAR